MKPGGDLLWQPLVSVIMPLYNKRPYVRRAVESILSQTYSRWELIIVDDGSTDGSTDEVPQDDPRIILFRQNNSGPAAARNRAVGRAGGELITFIDADDYYYPHKIETDVRILGSNPSAAWLISAFDLQLDGIIRRCPIRGRGGAVRDSAEGDEFLCPDALRDLTVAGWHINGFCCRREMLSRTGGFDEQMRFNEITEFLVRSALAEPAVAVCQRPLYRVVEVPQSASKVRQHVTEGLRQIGERLLEMSREHPCRATELFSRGCESLYSYVAALILSGRTEEARAYLRAGCPRGMGARWWKLWIGSRLPLALVRHVAGKPDAVFCGGNAS